MARSGRTRSRAKDETPPRPGARRDRLARLLTLITLGCLGLAFFRSQGGTYFLMPGPLASAHGAIEKCSACHTKSGTGKVGWLNGLVAGDPFADSAACLTCHEMPNTSLNAHGTSTDTLKLSTRRLAKVGATTSAPISSVAQNIAFPTQDIMQGGVFCATCHQEHKGAGFDLKKVTNAQCQSCHVVKFDNFDGNHPKFDNYPFGRRTRIVYDHSNHFGKHFPEVAGKDAGKRIPETCSTCHSSREDKQIMAVAPFDQTCSTCHLNQIVGNERASGPKGIAFLTLPGLDVQTLKEKNASIGEWPEESEAELTPFMKMMISRTEKGRALIKTVDGLKLSDLADANDEQIKAVTGLVWEIKGLFYALISGKASDVLGDLNIGGGGKLSPGLVADLTASLPRDVVISAHQEWLPELGTEMANRQDAGDIDQSGWSAAITESRLAASVSPEEFSRAVAPRFNPLAAGTGAPVRLAQANQQTDDLLFPDGGAPAAPNRAPPAEPEPAAAAPPPAGNAGAAPAARPEVPREAPSADARPAGGGGSGQTDDLLFPDGGAPEAVPGRPAPVAAPDANIAADPAPPAGAPSSGGFDAVVESQDVKAAPVVIIKSDVDPESWAEYGGWYRQDYAIFYRPTGHKDKFIYSWLFLTGPQAPKGNKSPAAGVFDALISKEAQGSCTKCHSVDDIRGKGRLVNFSPPKVEVKQGRFTSFIHEPHFAVLENRGCLTCHNLEKGRPYLKSFEQGNPQSFVSNFGGVKKELCQACHTDNSAGQDCLTCHKYHVNGTTRSIMNTKIPLQ